MAKTRRLPFKKRKSNIYDLSGEYGVGYTLKNEAFYFDLEDYEKINQYYWYIDKNGYVVSALFDKLIYMHRLVLNCLEDAGCDVDHIYHKKFDNRKSELRICKHKDNCKNTKLRTNNNTGVTGVSIRKEKCKKKYRAIICVDGKDIKLGSFETFEEAVQARKAAEKKYFGEYRYKDNVGGEFYGASKKEIYV